MLVETGRLYFEKSKFPVERCCMGLEIVKMSGIDFKICMGMSFTRILATRDTQFGQELALVMQTTHAQRWHYPDVSTGICFLPLKMYTGITKILEFEYKTCMF